MSVNLLPTVAVSPSAGSQQLDLCFAGVQFVFIGAPHLLEFVSLAAAPLRGPAGFAKKSDNSRAFARLRCHLLEGGPAHAPGAIFGPQKRELAYEWREGTGHAFTWGASAQIAKAGEEWCAEANVEPNQRAAQNLLTLLTYSLVHFTGGVVLHAASVEWTEKVVAFIGPSGAGKSTACAHAVGARLFSADRLAVVPASRPSATQCGWFAHTLPEGTPLVGPGLPISDSPGSSLRAILRMRQVQEGCWFEPCKGSRAVALLRESAFHAHRGTDAEGDVLHRLEQLALSIPVGNLHFSLGTPLGPLLRRWLHDGTFHRTSAVTDVE